MASVIREVGTLRLQNTIIHATKKNSRAASQLAAATNTTLYSLIAHKSHITVLQYSFTKFYKRHKHIQSQTHTPLTNWTKRFPNLQRSAGHVLQGSNTRSSHQKENIHRTFYWLSPLAISTIPARPPWSPSHNYLLLHYLFTISQYTRLLSISVHLPVASTYCG